MFCNRIFWTCVFVCFILKTYVFFDLKNYCRRDFRIEFVDLKKHYRRDFRIDFVLFAIFNQFALKIKKNIFVND